MSTFRELWESKQRQFHYRLKTVVPMDDDRMDDLERLMNRYNLLKMGSPQVMDGDMDTLDFVDVENADVTHVDFVIGVPMSAYILQQEARAVLNAPEKYVVVRADNEPMEVESTRLQMLQVLHKNNQERGLTHKGSLLSTDAAYLEQEQPLATDVFGDTYNKRLLNVLADVSENRPHMTRTAHSDLQDADKLQQTQAAHMPDAEDFNAVYDTPKPVSKSSTMPPPVPPALLNNAGSFDDDTRRYFTVRKDRKLQTVVSDVLSKPVRGSQK